MGYYTCFALTVQEIKPDGTKITLKDSLTNADLYQRLKITFGNVVGEDCFEQLLDHYYDAKWYNVFDQMRVIAKHYPQCIFILEGIGEEHNDWWKFAICGTKEQYAEATPPKLDENFYKS